MDRSRPQQAQQAAAPIQVLWESGEDRRSGVRFHARAAIKEQKKKREDTDRLGER